MQVCSIREDAEKEENKDRIRENARKKKRVGKKIEGEKQLSKNVFCLQ